jgi:DNA-binding NarL/FixJ family response regulator
MSPQSAGPPDVLLLAGVDDHPIVIEGVVAAIGLLAPNVQWLGSATSWAGLQERLSEWEPRPDLVLVDLHLRDGSDPIEMISDLRDRDIAVVVFTSELRPIPIRRAVAAGAQGVALKADPPSALVDVIRDVAAGNFAVSSDLAYVLVTDPDLVAHLAPREAEVLTLLAEGVPRKTIGRRLDPPVEMSTVITYLNRIGARYRALGREIGSIADTLREATADGYLSPTPMDH